MNRSAASPSLHPLPDGTSQCASQSLYASTDPPPRRCPTQPPRASPPARSPFAVRRPASRFHRRRPPPGRGVPGCCRRRARSRRPGSRRARCAHAVAVTPEVAELRCRRLSPKWAPHDDRAATGFGPRGHDRDSGSVHRQPLDPSPRCNAVYGRLRRKRTSATVARAPSEAGSFRLRAGSMSGQAIGKHAHCATTSVRPSRFRSTRRDRPRRRKGHGREGRLAKPSIAGPEQH